MKIFKNQSASQPAFTFIEIIVVIGIFTLLMSAAVVNYRSSSRQSQLRLTTQGLATNIRLAQSYAVGSKDFVDLDGSDHISQAPLGGWGVYFDINYPKYYQIVVDLNDDQSFDSNDKAFRKINLPDSIIIDQIIDNSGAINEGTIFFKPPEPQTFINGQSNNWINIILKDQAEATTSQVTVNFFGLVEVE